ncbi:MAG: hypothetical protein Q7O66_14925 [Dehalococcoidia bacterium]|nr:hypothetical protein [Dehalococcoidia bacterium]
MDLEVVAYYDKPETISVGVDRGGVRLTAPGISLQLTLSVARSLAYRLLAIAEYEG